MVIVGEEDEGRPPWLVASLNPDYINPHRDLLGNPG
jgi:hypothetical protein